MSTITFPVVCVSTVTVASSVGVNETILTPTPSPCAFCVFSGGVSTVAWQTSERTSERVRAPMDEHVVSELQNKIHTVPMLEATAPSSDSYCCVTFISPSRSWPSISIVTATKQLTSTFGSHSSMALPRSTTAVLPAPVALPESVLLAMAFSCSIFPVAESPLETTVADHWRKSAKGDGERFERKDTIIQKYR